MTDGNCNTACFTVLYLDSNREDFITAPQPISPQLHAASGADRLAARHTTQPDHLSLSQRLLCLFSGSLVSVPVPFCQFHDRLRFGNTLEEDQHGVSKPVAGQGSDLFCMQVHFCAVLAGFQLSSPRPATSRQPS
jgi:hypothetical protein